MILHRLPKLIKENMDTDKQVIEIFNWKIQD